MKDLFQKIGASDKRMAFVAILTLAMVSLVTYVAVVKPYLAEKKMKAATEE